jgi:CTP synthase
MLFDFCFQAGSIKLPNNYFPFVELKAHPFFVAVQYHPEFKSRPNRPHPLFASFIGKVLGVKQGQTTVTATP